MPGVTVRHAWSRPVLSEVAYASPSFKQLFARAGAPLPTHQLWDRCENWPKLPCYVIGKDGCGVAAGGSFEVDKDLRNHERELCSQRAA